MSAPAPIDAIDSQPQSRVKASNQKCVPASDLAVLWRFLLWTVPVKAVLFLLDPYPAFHFGDSGAYLATALIKYIPPDRSFTYGFLLWPLVIGSHSLLPVVIAQVVLSTVASAIVGMLLVRYCRLPYIWGACVAVLCAVEPIQLMFERFVMTEVVATFGFSLFFWVCLAYLKSRSLYLLVLIQVIGVVLVSLRYSFLPLVIALSLILPVLAWKRNRRAVLAGVVTAVVASQGLLYGYRHLYGSLANTKPAYLSRDGTFLIADMAPLIKPQDFPIAAQRQRLFGLLTLPLDNIHFRRYHRWYPGGICDAVLQVCHGDDELANKLSRQTAIRAMKRDPLGVMELAALTYRDFLSWKQMRWGLRLDRGYFVPPSPDDQRMIRNWFDVDANYRHYKSLTKRWEGIAELWCFFIVILPFIYLIEMAVHRRRVTAIDALTLTALVILLLTAIVPVEIANPRYLIPLPWLSLFTVGVMCSRFRGRVST